MVSNVIARHPIPSALVSELDEPLVPSGAGCRLCGRATYDPDKRSRPWVRGVSAGSQALVCPKCQATNPGWDVTLDRCERCGSIRLSLTLGEVTCRACGHLQGSVEVTDSAVDDLLER